MGSDVSSSAKMQPIAQISEEKKEQFNIISLVAVSVGRGADGWCCTHLTDGFGVVPSPQQQFRCSVPEGDHHRVQIG